MAEDEDRTGKLKKLSLKIHKNIEKFANNPTTIKSYVFPTLDKIFEKTYLKKNSSLFSNAESAQDMHDDFLSLIMDTFNLSIEDTYLAQISMNLIVRYYSDTAEFLRNMDRMVLLYDEKEYTKYQFIHLNLQQLNRKLEKSHLWMSADDEDSRERVEMRQIMKILGDLKKLCYFKHKITKDDEGNFIFEKNEESSKNPSKFI